MNPLLYSFNDGMKFLTVNFHFAGYDINRGFVTSFEHIPTCFGLIDVKTFVSSAIVFEWLLKTECLKIETAIAHFEGFLRKEKINPIKIFFIIELTKIKCTVMKLKQVSV